MEIRVHGGVITGKRLNEASEVVVMFHMLIWVMTMQVYSLCRYQAEHLSYVHFHIYIA